MSFKLKALGKLVARKGDDVDRSNLENLYVPNHHSVIKFAPKCNRECCDSSSDTNDCGAKNAESETEVPSLKRKRQSFENIIKETGAKLPHLSNEEDPPPMVNFCSRCGYAFDSNADLKTHECLFTPTSPCVVCGILLNQNVYGDHLISHVHDARAKEGNDANTEIKCVYCSKFFDNKTALLVHYRNHIAQFQCASCKSFFFSALDLKDHVVKEHNRVEHQLYHCYICNRRFTHQEAIVNHMRLHSHEMPYTCKECGRSFNQIGNLQRHINTHRGERPYRCQECACKFTDPATLRNHARIHSGELPFVCQVCKRGFSQIGNLRRHMAKHITSDILDRRFRCPHCGQGFAHESTLRNHLRTHTGEQPFKCTLCNRAFSQIGNLKRHMAKHSAEQDFLCGSCNRCFSSSTELVHHLCVSAEVKDKAEVSADCCMITPWPSSPNYQAGSPDSSGRSCRTSSESSSGETDQSNDGAMSSKMSEYLPSNSDEESSCSTNSVNRKWRIFPCLVCGKVYTWQHDLKIHFRIHSGEKPFKCDVCDKQFAQSGAIRTHKRRHHPNGN